MAIVKVPKPPQSAMNKNRAISSLLKTQIKHLQEAEFRLPAEAQSNIYINAIKTEGEAADYIRQVTAALHAEHAAAQVGRQPKRQPKAAKKLMIAAMAQSKRSASSKSKRTTRSRKKTS
jgi:hypothetical protein